MRRRATTPPLLPSLPVLDAYCIYMRPSTLSAPSTPVATASACGHAGISLSTTHHIWLAVCYCIALCSYWSRLRSSGVLWWCPGLHPPSGTVVYADHWKDPSSYRVVGTWADSGEDPYVWLDVRQLALSLSFFLLLCLQYLSFCRSLSYLCAAGPLTSAIRSLRTTVAMLPFSSTPVVSSTGMTNQCRDSLQCAWADASDLA